MSTGMNVLPSESLLCLILILPIISCYDYYGMFLEHLISEKVLAEVERHSVERSVNITTTTSTIIVPTTEPPIIIQDLLDDSPNETSSTTTSTLPSFIESHLVSAHYSGNQWLVIDASDDAVDYVELSLHFKPASAFGLIFFWENGPRHIALYLRKGFLTAEVTMGADTVILRSEADVVLDKWHKAEFWRTGRGLLMKIDHQPWVEGELISLGSIAVNENAGKVHIGSYENDLPGHLRGLPGFHGCLKHVRLNGHLIRQHTTSTGIRVCGSDACASAGCPTACSTHDDEAICLCSWPNFGEKCEQTTSTRINAMNFNKYSYLELKDSKYVNEITGDSLHISMLVRLKNSTDQSSSQLLLFAGDHDAQLTGDFFYTKINSENSVMLSMNLGSGSVELTHPTKLVTDKWYTISVNREKRHVTLTIDGQSPISTVAPGDSEQLNVYSAFYIGGVPFRSKLGDGLVGCVQSIDIGPNFIVHPSEATSAINIRDCII